MAHPASVGSQGRGTRVAAFAPSPRASTAFRRLRPTLPATTAASTAESPTSWRVAMNPLIVALDVPSLDDASVLAKRIGDAAAGFKVGLELFAAEGPRAVTAIEAPVFLDLKLHDIPTTV